MTSGSVVHFIGGPLSGRIEFLPPWGMADKPFAVYKLYPTVMPAQAYGIPRAWQVEKLGYSDVVALELLAKLEVDILDFMIDMGKSKIARVSQEMNSLLLPLTVDTSIEEIELVEGFRVKSISISALAALPE